MKDSSRHVVLGTQQFKPSEFAAQINLSLDNCWGIVRCIIDQVMAQKDGEILKFDKCHGVLSLHPHIFRTWQSPIWIFRKHPMDCRIWKVLDKQSVNWHSFSIMLRFSTHTLTLKFSTRTYFDKRNFYFIGSSKSYILINTLETLTNNCKKEKVVIKSNQFELVISS